MPNFVVSIDGGDLGTATGTTKIEMIPVLVMRIAEIFSQIRYLRPPGQEFSYCFQFNPIYKRTVSSMLADIEREGLPIGTHFYETDGSRVFDMRGSSGGVVYSCCFYLITKN